MLAEVAVVLDIGPYQVAHLHWFDLPTFAVAELTDKNSPGLGQSPASRVSRMDCPVDGRDLGPLLTPAG